MQHKQEPRNHFSNSFVRTKVMAAGLCHMFIPPHRRSVVLRLEVWRRIQFNQSRWTIFIMTAVWVDGCFTVCAFMFACERDILDPCISVGVSGLFCLSWVSQHKDNHWLHHLQHKKPQSVKNQGSFHFREETELQCWSIEGSSSSSRKPNETFACPKYFFFPSSADIMEIQKPERSR